jgi:hypothetical protein
MLQAVEYHVRVRMMLFGQKRLWLIGFQANEICLNEFVKGQW